MLRDLTIQNYRCFKDFHIDGLARVNLIVGMNNSGKTSLLEAVYLLVSQGNPRCLAELLENRDEVVESSVLGEPGKPDYHQINYQVRHLFYAHRPNLNSKIALQTQTEEYAQIQIELQPNEQRYPSENQYFTQEIPFKLVFSSGSNEKVALGVNFDGLIEARSFNMFRPENLLSHSFIPVIDSIGYKSLFLTNNNISFDKLSALWNRITLTPKEDQVVDALRILEPTLERISFTSSNFNSGILVRLRGQYPIPIGTMGGGMRRILNLAMAAVTVENGFLLIDEIETGLYYETQTDMWRLILEIAQQLNVQVFATTHSWDCICAFQEALEQSKDRSAGKLFRLSQRGEDIRAVEYTPDELSVAVRQSIEVR